MGLSCASDVRSELRVAWRGHTVQCIALEFDLIGMREGHDEVGATTRPTWGRGLYTRTAVGTLPLAQPWTVRQVLQHDVN